MLEHIEEESRRYERFIKKVQIDDKGCWNWTGCKCALGYGQFYYSNKTKSRAKGTHRYSYEAHKGPIPEGLSIDHLCRNPSCCNPDHLEAVTRGENNSRAWAATSKERQLARVSKAGRVAAELLKSKTHCKHGHERTGYNAYIYKGRQDCRTCRKRRKQESRARLERRS